MSKALEKLATDLPQMMLQYSLQMSKMEADSAHATKMLEMRLQHDSQLRKEKQGLQEVGIAFNSAYNSLMTDKKIAEQNIIDLTNKINATETQIRGISGDFESLKGEVKTESGEELPERLKALFSGPTLTALEVEYDNFNKIKDQESLLKDRMNKTNEILTNLSSIERHTQRVAPNLGEGPKDIHQADDYRVYFDNVLVMQLKSDGTPISDAELPGNSSRFHPDDEFTPYYREVFTSEFAPSAEAQRKQSVQNYQMKQTALANFKYLDKESDAMFAQFKTTLNSSIYEYETSGGTRNKVTKIKGFDTDSAVYQSGIDYIIKAGYSEENAEDILTTAISRAGNVIKASTFINDIEPKANDSEQVRNNKMFMLGLYDALGMGQTILELQKQVGDAKIAKNPPSIDYQDQRFYGPASTDPDVNNLLNQLRGMQDE